MPPIRVDRVDRVDRSDLADRSGRVDLADPRRRRSAPVRRRPRWSAGPKGCPVIPGGRTTTATAPRCVVGSPEYAQYE
ncbi:hypothetical protein ACWGI8_37545, partial [Streptomyces sp. NPDC054841]